MHPVFDIVPGEPFKQSAELTGEPIKMKAEREHCSSSLPSSEGGQKGYSRSIYLADHADRSPPSSLCRSIYMSENT